MTKELTDWYVVRVASKLWNEGILIDNYTDEKATEILNKVVSPTFCKRILFDNKEAVLSTIASFGLPPY